MHRRAWIRGFQATPETVPGRDSGARLGGKGYATEALRAVVAWGDEHFQSRRTICIIHRDNHRSFRVAEKLGYGVVLQSPDEAETDAILARDAPAVTPGND
jgi:RimJ/RimL family protein N-acetyltransferase